MSKPYTPDKLSNQLAADRNWRIKEISNLKTSVKLADNVAQPTLLRAMVTICYAHWEGSVKFTASKYMQFVALRKLPYRKLKSQFLTNQFLPSISGMYGKRASTSEACKIIEKILSAENNTFSQPNAKLINTRSNLNFDVLKDICIVCDIDVSKFISHQTFIDKFLLGRRNAIAHGESLPIEVIDLDRLSNQTITIMRLFSNEIENIVTQESYRGPTI